MRGSARGGGSYRGSYYSSGDSYSGSRSSSGYRSDSYRGRGRGSSYGTSSSGRYGSDGYSYDSRYSSSDPYYSSRDYTSSSHSYRSSDLYYDKRPSTDYKRTYSTEDLARKRIKSDFSHYSGHGSSSGRYDTSYDYKDSRSRYKEDYGSASGYTDSYKSRSTYPVKQRSSSMSYPTETYPPKLERRIDTRPRTVAFSQRSTYRPTTYRGRGFFSTSRIRRATIARPLRSRGNYSRIKTVSSWSTRPYSTMLRGMVQKPRYRMDRYVGTSNREMQDLIKKGTELLKSQGVAVVR